MIHLVCSESLRRYIPDEMLATGLPAGGGAGGGGGSGMKVMSEEERMAEAAR